MKRDGVGRRGVRTLFKGWMVAWFALAPSACATTWYGSVCASNESGACRATTDRVHERRLESSHGLIDRTWAEPSCPNGFGRVTVHAIDAHTIDLRAFCLVDAPVGTMTLPAGTAPPAGDPATGGR